MSPMIPVLSAPLLDPSHGRIDFEVAPGTTLANIVAQAMPGRGPGCHDHLRVMLVSDHGAVPVASHLWARVRPRPGVRVVIRAVPGGDDLRSVLLAVVSVAALALAPAVAGLIGVTGSFGVALVSAGLTVVGSFLVNALVPAQVPPSTDRRNTFSITGWRNEIRPGAPVPFALGRHRYSPPFAATSYTEVLGDIQYVRALFCFGYGPVDLTDLRLGETAITSYDEVEIEIREGRPGDAPLTLYPRQVLEESTGVELIRPLPRDDAGEIIAGPSIATPVLRFTASDTKTISVLIGFPAGLFRVDDDGEVRNQTVSLRIRQRLNGSGDWTTVTTLAITAAKRESFLRQHSWDPPSRGRWQIEVMRMTDDSADTTISDRAVLSAVQSIRPEYPVNIGKPMALVALRIKATYQLNGSLDNFNGLVRHYGLIWNGSAWVEGLSRNPATAFLSALRGPANPYPVSDSEIDWDLIRDWFQFCATKGLKYDRVHDEPESLAEMQAAICAAGRATFRHDGLKWGVVIDRPQEMVIDHINPRNSAEFTWARQYFEPPHAIRVTFADETAQYEQAERIVPWPGHTGPITLTETLALPGKTDPDEIWRETRRRMYELIHRSDIFTAVQDGASRVATRGDLVMLNTDVLARSQVTARVTAVVGNLVEIDEEITMTEAVTHGIRFRTYPDPDDVIGASVVRNVPYRTGSSNLLRLSGTGALPAVGALVHFGQLATESFAVRVKGIEAGENFASRLTMVAAATIIDDLTDAEVPPAWDGRVGDEVTPAAVTPPAPRFVSVESGEAGTGSSNGLAVLLLPGTSSAAILANYEIDHRLVGAGTWTTITVPVAEGGAAIPGYTSGNTVNLRARSIATDGTPGTYTPTLTVTIGQTEPALPAALDSNGIEVTGGLGNAEVRVALSADRVTKRIQLYRVPAGDTLNRAVHKAGAPFGVTPSATVTYIDGDGTRRNGLVNAGFDSGASWTLDANWAIGGGTATHTPGAADTIRQSRSPAAAKVQRISFRISGRTTGSVTAKLFGGTEQTGTAKATNTQHLDSITSGAGNSAFGFEASSNFDGSIDDVVVYTATDACVAQGNWDYYLEPQTAAGIPGPIAGPFAARII
ncbi:MAG: phage tail protein [Rhodobacterales bacterium]|nr:phage tail protein [Rhodobacterales bacterium]